MIEGVEQRRYPRSARTDRERVDADEPHEVDEPLGAGNAGENLENSSPDAGLEISGLGRR